METYLIVLLVIIILVILIAIALKIYGSKRQIVMYAIRKILGASEENDPINRKTEEYVDKFLSDRFTPELAAQMESLANDIAYDISDIKPKNSAGNDTMYAKLLLDTMLHYYIYDKSPNTVSHDAIVSNIKLINSFKDAKISGEKVKRLTSIAAGIFKSGEEKTDLTSRSTREYFRRERILNTRVGTECDALRDELSRKAVELRSKTEEIEK